MNKASVKDLRLFLLIFALSILFSSLVFKMIYPLHYGIQPLFFSDLLGFSAGFSAWVIYIFGLLDVLLVWLIGKIFFKKFYAYFFMALFSLSPWFTYSVATGSFYIYLLFLILACFLGLYLIQSERRRIGNLVFIIFSILLLYSSIVFLVSYFLLVSGLIVFRVIQFNNIKLALLIILIICLPSIVLIFKNTVGFKNVLSNQINFLSNPGLQSNINVFQGESKKVGLVFVSKLSENKYIYTLKYVILKFTKNIVPSTFFTPEEKLLGFSFTPPIYLGLLIPFLYGGYLILNLKMMRKYLFLSLILVLPSFFSEKMVDLNRLILFEPVAIFIIVYGLERLSNVNKKLARIIYSLCFVLVFIQIIVTLSDISLREYPRFERYQGIAHWQIDKQ